MDLQKFHNFESAGREILEFLYQRYGFDLWLIAHTEGDDWVVLQVVKGDYTVEPGAVYPWKDTFCSRMIAGEGPRIATHSDKVPAYASAGIGNDFDIKAYVGMPLTLSDGNLFGTLCGISPKEQPSFPPEDQQLIELLSSLLSTILQGDLHALEESRRISQLESESRTDELTAIYNRRAWNDVMEVEEDACQQFGYPASVIIIDLDGLKEVNDTRGHSAGDELLINAATILQKTVRSKDILARLGGDEFGILCRECNLVSAKQMVSRIRRQLNKAGIIASIGVSARDVAADLNRAWELADELMYREKHGKDDVSG